MLSWCCAGFDFLDQEGIIRGILPRKRKISLFLKFSLLLLGLSLMLPTVVGSGHSCASPHIVEESEVICSDPNYLCVETANLDTFGGISGPGGSNFSSIGYIMEFNVSKEGIYSFFFQQLVDTTGTCNFSVASSDTFMVYLANNSGCDGYHCIRSLEVFIVGYEPIEVFLNISTYTLIFLSAVPGNFCTVIRLSHEINLLLPLHNKYFVNSMRIDTFAVTDRHIPSNKNFSVYAVTHEYVQMYVGMIDFNGEFEVSDEFDWVVAQPYYNDYYRLMFVDNSNSSNIFWSYSFFVDTSRQVLWDNGSAVFFPYNGCDIEPKEECSIRPYPFKYRGIWDAYLMKGNLQYEYIGKVTDSISWQIGSEDKYIDGDDYWIKLHSHVNTSVEAMSETFALKGSIQTNESYDVIVYFDQNTTFKPEVYIKINWKSKSSGLFRVDLYLLEEYLGKACIGESSCVWQVPSLDEVYISPNYSIRVSKDDAYNDTYGYSLQFFLNGTKTVVSSSVSPSGEYPFVTSCLKSNLCIIGLSSTITTVVIIVAIVALFTVGFLFLFLMMFLFFVKSVLHSFIGGGTMIVDGRSAEMEERVPAHMSQFSRADSMKLGIGNIPQ